MCLLAPVEPCKSSQLCSVAVDSGLSLLPEEGVVVSFGEITMLWGLPLLCCIFLDLSESQARGWMLLVCHIVLDGPPESSLGKVVQF